MLLHLYGYLRWAYVELLCGQDSFFGPHVLQHHCRVHNVIAYQERLVLRGRDGVLERQDCRERKGCEQQSKSKKVRHNPQCLL